MMTTILSVASVGGFLSLLAIWEILIGFGEWMVVDSQGLYLAQDGCWTDDPREEMKIGSRRLAWALADEAGRGEPER